MQSGLDDSDGSSWTNWTALTLDLDRCWTARHRTLVRRAFQLSILSTTACRESIIQNLTLTANKDHSLMQWRHKLVGGAMTYFNWGRLSYTIK